MTFLLPICLRQSAILLFLLLDFAEVTSDAACARPPFHYIQTHQAASLDLVAHHAPSFSWTKQYVLQLANELRDTRYHEYNSHIRHVHTYKVSLVGSYRFFIVRYDRVITTLEIFHVDELPCPGPNDS